MEKINVAQLLKDCPKGMELDCYLFNGLEFAHIDTDNENYPIVCRAKDSTGEYYTHTFTKYGWYTSSYDYSKCVIFPKGKTTWEGFKRPFKDGDILTTSIGSIFIFSHLELDRIDDRNICKAYVGIRDTMPISLFRAEEESDIFGPYESMCKFSTKEEKEKLFDAIKENGYKWNSETKTLEKLVEPKFKAGDRIILKDNPHNIPSVKIKAVTKSQYILENEGFFYIDSTDEKYVLENKFDINTLVPFESRVLVRDTKSQKWSPAIWGFYDSDHQEYQYKLIGVIARYCIPYEGNQHLLGTTDDCDKYFKTWE